MLSEYRMQHNRQDDKTNLSPSIVNLKRNGDRRLLAGSASSPTHTIDPLLPVDTSDVKRRVTVWSGRSVQYLTGSSSAKAAVADSAEIGPQWFAQQSYGGQSSRITACDFNLLPDPNWPDWFFCHVR